MLYNQCAAVNEEFWRDLRAADREDIARRTGIRRQQNVFRFPYFNQEAVVDLVNNGCSGRPRRQRSRAFASAWLPCFTCFMSIPRCWGRP